MPNAAPRLSVTMLAYNRREYVGQAIESVLEQRHADFELIVVDDASSDGTSEIIDRHARQDHRIRACAMRRTRESGSPAKRCWRWPGTIWWLSWTTTTSCSRTGSIGKSLS